jgi:hypothetical protein
MPRSVITYLKRPEEEDAILAADDLLTRIREAIDRQLSADDRMSVEGAYYLIIDALDVAQEQVVAIRQTAEHVRRRRGQARKGPPPAPLIHVL